MTARKDDYWRGLDIFNSPTLPEETLEGIDAVEALEAFHTPTSFGSLGSYGVSSAELPAMTPQTLRRAQQAQRDAWQSAQKLHSEAARSIADAYRNRIISPIAYDLLQDELSAGYTPNVFEYARGQWRVWSGMEQHSYSLNKWEERAQEMLPISHPDRQTHILRRTPSIRPTQRPTAQPAYATQDWQRPWAPALDSGFRGAPTPRLRATPRPVGMPAGLSAGFGVAAPATVPLLRDDTDPEKRGLC